MRSQLSGLAAANEPVSVHTFGFGADHDAKLLQAVAEAGHGIYYFIQASQFVGFAKACVKVNLSSLSIHAAVSACMQL
jgi:hypothetical protein